MIVERAVPDNTIRMDSFRVMRRSLFSTASLYLDFSTNYGFAASIPSSASSLLTTTRASTGYADTLSGTYLPFLSDIPRITDKGLLVEEARTNSIRNNSMQGAVAGTPGTAPTNWSVTDIVSLTKSIVGTQTVNGVEYVGVRYAGTTSGTSGALSFEASTQIAALLGQSWSESAFLFATINSGATPDFALRISERDGAGAPLASNTSSTLAVTGSPARFSYAATLGNASTAFALPQLIMTLANTTAYDFTIWVGWPQLELGAFATSPIRTTSASATRAADAITVTSPPSFGAAQTLFAQARLPQLTTVVNDVQAPVWLSDGTTANVVGLGYYQSVADLRARVFTAGVSEASIDAGTLSADTRFKVAFALAVNDGAVSLDGATPVTDTSIALPTIGSFNVGRDNASHWANGYIERIAYFPTRLTNAQLQAITAP